MTKRGGKVVMRIVMTEEERQWIHKILRLEEKNFPSIVISIFEELGEKHNLPFPKNRVKRIKYQDFRPYYNGKIRFFKKIEEELNLNAKQKNKI